MWQKIEEHRQARVAVVAIKSAFDDSSYQRIR